MKYFLTLLAVLAIVASVYPHPVEQESLEGADTNFKVDADVGNIRKVRNYGYPYGGFGGLGSGVGGGYGGSSSSAFSTSSAQSSGEGYGGGNGGGYGGGYYPTWGYGK